MPRAALAKKHIKLAHTKIPIQQSQLKTYYQLQEEEAEARRLWRVEHARLEAARMDLLDKQLAGAPIKQGPYKPNATRIEAHRPRYKKATMDLAKRVGRDPEKYCEELRAKTPPIIYWRYRVE